MKRTTVLLGLALAGCHPRPDIEACERFITTGLANSASYRRERVAATDTPIDPAGLAKAAGLATAADGLAGAIARTQTSIWSDMKRSHGGDLALRRMAITYSSSEPTVRDVRVCGFAVAGDTLEPRAALLASAERAIRRSRARALVATVGGRTGNKLRDIAGRAPELECCLAP